MQNPYLPPKHTTSDEDAGQTNIPLPAVPSTSTDTTATSQPTLEGYGQPSSKPLRRRRQQQQQQQPPPLLMRRWLQKLADDGDIPGLEWIDKDHKTLLRIPWCHGSRSEWNQDRSALFRAWAEHKGPYIAPLSFLCLQLNIC